MGDKPQCKYCPKRMAASKLPAHHLQHHTRYSPLSIYRCDTCKIELDCEIDVVNHFSAYHLRPTPPLPFNLKRVRLDDYGDADELFHILESPLQPPSHTLHLTNLNHPPTPLPEENPSVTSPLNQSDGQFEDNEEDTNFVCYKIDGQTYHIPLQTGQQLTFEDICAWFGVRESVFFDEFEDQEQLRETNTTRNTQNTQEDKIFDSLEEFFIYSYFQQEGFNRYFTQIQSVLNASQIYSCNQFCSNSDLHLERVPDGWH